MGIERRIERLEQEYAPRLRACPTCRTWREYVVLYYEDEAKGTHEYRPHPPSCPDCGREIAKVIRGELWDAL